MKWHFWTGSISAYNWRTNKFDMTSHLKIVAPDCTYADGAGLDLVPTLHVTTGSTVDAFKFQLPTGSQYILTTEIVETTGNPWSGTARFIGTGD